MEIGKTMSVCPVCLTRIPAVKTLGEDGNLYLEKKCWEHGNFRTLIWEGDLESYLGWAAGDSNAPVTPVRAREAERGCPNDCGLCQNHARDGCCVLLELTNRCNLCCPVCFASAGEQKPYDLPLEEIGRQYDLLMEHGGPFNIQLSGGEPTMRRDLDKIIALGREKGFTFFQLNTNGIRIAQEDGYAEHLAKAGVSTVFLQFDGLDDIIYQTLRGAQLTETKLRAIENCKAAGLPVVLVPTVAPGVNDHALGDILRFALAHAPHVRGVHIQPISYFGRCGLEAPERRLTIPAVLRRIEAQMEGLMKASDFGGGGAESPYCSFHASYLRKSDGSLKALPRRIDTVSRREGTISMEDLDSALFPLETLIDYRASFDGVLRIDARTVDGLGADWLARAAEKCCPGRRVAVRVSPAFPAMGPMYMGKRFVEEKADAK